MSHDSSVTSLVTKGSEATRIKMLPLITEIIPKIEDNSELMLVLTEQLGLLADYIGPQKYLPLLLYTLELAATNDEAAVRDKTVESMSRVASKFDESQYTSELLPLLMKWSKGQAYTSKVTAAGLIPLLYSHVNAQRKELLYKVYNQFYKDEVPIVRKAAVASFAEIASMIETSRLKKNFMPILKKLIVDNQELVRVAATEMAGKVIASHKNKEINEALLPLMKQAAEEKRMWRLRFTLAETISSIAGDITKSEVDGFLLNWICDLLGDSEPEVRTQALLSLPKVAKRCSISLLVEKVFPMLKTRLIKDISEHVRIALATAIPMYSALILSLIHICRCRRYAVCRSRWSPYH
eukprot:TRINITY_DN3415_c0_g2_i4.p1 TRINITY_DN3415_c0_g2~~TRINITY_DN3415_c0_g2_i4.p1  ORF type:complete len:352 (-),score=49.97 TRINITY_DN3415_c0_g2_i4:22-1077(-)